MVGNPFSHLLNSFHEFLCKKKIFFFKNRGKSNTFHIKKKFFFCPLTDFHLPTLKILFFSKMVGNPFSHRLDSFEAKKICFANNAP